MSENVFQFQEVRVLRADDIAAPTDMLHVQVCSPHQLPFARVSVHLGRYVGKLLVRLQSM
jgi:hypothetical protein